MGDSLEELCRQMLDSNRQFGLSGATIFCAQQGKESTTCDFSPSDRQDRYELSTLH